MSEPPSGRPARRQAARPVDGRSLFERLFEFIMPGPDSKAELIKTLADAEQRELIHKIGVTGGDVQRRITNAKLDATFLLADVDVVTTYTLYHINRTKLENLLHKFFAPGRLDITITDRFGNPVQPREWFQVPLFIIDEAIERIRDGSITEYRYDPARVALVRHDAT